MPLLRNLMRAFDKERAVRNARREHEVHEEILVEIDALAARLRAATDDGYEAMSA